MRGALAAGSDSAKDAARQRGCDTNSCHAWGKNASVSVVECKSKGSGVHPRLSNIMPQKQIALLFTQADSPPAFAQPDPRFWARLRYPDGARPGWMFPEQLSMGWAGSVDHLEECLDY